MIRADWTHGHWGAGEKAVMWTHTSGWQVCHCGHPLAHNPWYLRDPAAPADTIVTPSGRGFHRVALAREAVEKLLRGELVVSRERCTPGTAIVVATVAA